jgi:phasin family protein
MFDQLLKQNEEMMKTMQSMMGFDAFQKATKPMTELLEMQRGMLESLTEQQTQLTTELMSDCLEEARQMCQCDSVPEVMEIHKKFLTRYQEKMAALAKKQAASMTQLSEEALSVMKKNTKDLAKTLNK